MAFLRQKLSSVILRSSERWCDGRGNMENPLGSCELLSSLHHMFGADVVDFRSELFNVQCRAHFHSYEARARSEPGLKLQHSRLSPVRPSLRNVLSPFVDQQAIALPDLLNVPADSRIKCSWPRATRMQPEDPFDTTRCVRARHLCTWST